MRTLGYFVYSEVSALADGRCLLIFSDYSNLIQGVWVVREADGFGRLVESILDASFTNP